MLELAHNPPDPEGVGRNPTPDEVTRLDAEFEALFFQIPIEEQVKFLSAISPREAALWLERMSTEARTDLFGLLPSHQQKAVVECWGNDHLVRLPA